MFERQGITEMGERVKKEGKDLKGREARGF